MSLTEADLLPNQNEIPLRFFLKLLFPVQEISSSEQHVVYISLYTKRNP